MNYSILSFNILSGLNDKRYPLSCRIIKIIEYVKLTNTDIICLQEVTKDVYTLLETNFIECGYFVSRTNVGREFVVIITKFQHTSTILQFDSNKACIIVKHKDIVIVGIHLTSDLARDSEAKRKLQIELIKNEVVSSNKVIIIGDVNMKYEITELIDFIDCGYGSTEPTFDTDQNEIAKICKKDEAGLLARLDRVYIKGFKCLDYKVDNVILSDHYPILVKIE